MEVEGVEISRSNTNEINFYFQVRFPLALVSSLL